eukprot:3843120-Amphidinium_carterae.2
MGSREECAANGATTQYDDGGPTQQMATTQSVAEEGVQQAETWGAWRWLELLFLWLLQLWREDKVFQ